MSAPSSSPSQLPASTWRATAIVLGIASLLMMALALYYRSPASSGAQIQAGGEGIAASPTLVLVVQHACDNPAHAAADAPQRTRQRRLARVST